MEAVSAPQTAPPPETAACVWCGKNERRELYPLVDKVWHKPGTFAMSRCEACGLYYLSPRPRQEDIGFYYQNLYDNEGLQFEESLQHGRIAGRINASRMRALNKRLACRPSARHLDVGCGVGGLAKQIVLKGIATTAVGVDFEEGAIESAKEHAGDMPLEFFAGTLESQQFDADSFSSVSMIHFLEHSYDPRTELREAFRVLEPGGAIVIEVPSATALGRTFYGNYWFPHLTPQHIVMFSRDTLRRAMEDAGFVDVEVRDCFAPLVWFSSFVLWYHHTLGGSSRWKKNIGVRLFTVLFTIVAIIPLLLADLFLAVFLPLIGRGDHQRATGLKPK